MFIRLTKEQQELMLADVQRFFYNERDEEITEFEAERILEFVKRSLAPYIYNAAILDAKYVMEQQLTTIDDELTALERPIKTK